MKKLSLLGLFCLPLFTSAQLISGYAFLQGRYLEIGMNPNGTFGTPRSAPAPTGYHPHHAGSSTDRNLGQVYDLGHDGWNVGYPKYMGDYTYNGSPYESWVIQVNGSRYSADATNPSSYISSASGSISSCTRVTGSYLADWSGSVDSNRLAISSRTEVDSQASWVYITVNFKNTSSRTLSNIYYLRTCDPDNTQAWPGGAFTTTNTVNYQNDADHRVMVSATTPFPLNTCLAIGCKDARAKAFAYSSWSLSGSADLSQIYAGTCAALGTNTYALNTPRTSDWAIGTVFNLGTLNPGDSTSLTFAYIFNGISGIDSAFPITTSSVANRFHYFTTKLCHGPEIRALGDPSCFGYTMKTDYGDGTFDSTALGHGYARPMSFSSHNYGSSGTYIIKQILFNGTTAIDSAVFSYQHVRCTLLPVEIYFDKNGNCILDTIENLSQMATTVGIDSNGTAIDSISCLAGFSYRALGRPGDIYKFRILHPGTGVRFTCPSVGYLADTIPATNYSLPSGYLGMTCSSTAFDLNLASIISVAGPRIFRGKLYVNNLICTPTNATVKMMNSPKCSFLGSVPAPSMVTANSAEWNLGTLSMTDAAPSFVSYWFTTVGALSLGDTIISAFQVDPMSGDAFPMNNVERDTDTVRASFDPNNMLVSPAYHTVSGAKLQYTINFENIGNDTALNIYILDTLPDNVDINSLEMKMASHTMLISKSKDSTGRYILRFDFPHINLLDSSHHGLCDGTVIFKINSKPGLLDCSHIFNRAGIYFDGNDVVLTNWVDNIIGCLPSGVSEVGETNDQVTVYPNPANDLLNIAVDGTPFTSYTITNSVGSTVLKDNISLATTQVKISMLPAGLYFVNLKGENGTVVKKFVKI